MGQNKSIVLGESHQQPIANALHQRPIALDTIFCISDLIALDVIMRIFGISNRSL